MKTFLLTVFSLLLGLGLTLAQGINFLGVVEKPSRTTPVEANLGATGGYITFDYSYRAGCVGGYKVKVNFSKSLNQLQSGETFQVTLNCEDCSTPCGYKWKIVGFFGSGDVRSIDQYPTYEYNGNLEILSSSNGSSGVNDHTPGMVTNTFTVRYEPKKQVPLTALKLIAAFDHEIYLVFGQEAGTSPANPTYAIRSGYWSGWGSTTLMPDRGGFKGTYSDTYVKSEKGVISLRPGSNGTWTGTWGEPAIGRSGTLYDIRISADGKRISGKYDVTQTGSKGGKVSGQSFTWTWKSAMVKR